MYPWELNPVLTEDRLVALARAAVSARNRAFAEADRAAGDTNWGLACKAHERLMFALGRLAHDGEHPWLSVTRDGLYLMPHIEDVAVKVYRGSVERIGSRHLDALRLEHERTEAARPQMAFGFMVGGEDDGGPWYWLMAQETDEAGMVARVVYVQANDAGETRYPWECPFAVEERVEPVVAAVPAPVEAAVEVAPTVPVEAPVVEAPVAAAPVAAGLVLTPVPAPEPAPAAAANETGRKRAPRRARPAPQQAELWGAVGAE